MGRVSGGRGRTWLERGPFLQKENTMHTDGVQTTETAADKDHWDHEADRRADACREDGEAEPASEPNS